MLLHYAPIISSLPKGNPALQGALSRRITNTLSALNADARYVRQSERCYQRTVNHTLYQIETDLEGIAVSRCSGEQMIRIARGLFSIDGLDKVLENDQIVSKLQAEFSGFFLVVDPAADWLENYWDNPKIYFHMSSEHVFLLLKENQAVLATLNLDTGEPQIRTFPIGNLTFMDRHIREHLLVLQKRKKRYKRDCRGERGVCGIAKVCTIECRHRS